MADTRSIEALEAEEANATAAMNAAKLALAEAVTAAAREAWPAAEWRISEWNAGAWLLATSERWNIDVVLTRQDGRWNVEATPDVNRLDGPAREEATADTLPDAMGALLALLAEDDADAVRAALGVP